MMERLQIPYPVIVEGRYDKLRLESVIEAQIFQVFRKRTPEHALKQAAEVRFADVKAVGNAL